MSKHDWDQIPFEDILADSKDGEWGIGEEAGSHTACWMIRGTDFSTINDPATKLPLRWIPDRLMARKRLQPGDVIFEMAGGTATQSTGRSSLVRRSFFEARTEHPILCASFCRHLRLKPAYDSSFLYYMLQTLYRAGYMGVFNIQHTGVSRFQYTAFKKKTILTIPRKPLQQKVAAILTAYDDLIENNQRRIAALEKMAEELYREWFVRLRFPGHEKSKFHIGHPADWKALRIEKIVNRLKFGRIYRRADLENEGKICVIDQSTDDFLGFHNGRPDHSASVDHPILLFGDHSCKMVFMTTPFSLAENVVPFIPKDSSASAYFLFYMIRNLIHTTEYKRHWTELTNKEVLTPTFSLQQQFQHLAKPLHEQVSLLSKSAQILTKSRELLLPRLISGKLRVDKLDIQFPPSMQAD